MKIFHMGDWHVGKLVNGFYMTEDQEFLMDSLFEKIKSEKPDVLLIAGDLYDRSVPPVGAVELLNKTFKKIIKELNTKVIAVAGNHDSNERIEFGSAMLKDSGLYLVGNLTKDINRIVIEDKFGPVNFYPIPYADVPVVRDLFEDEEIKTYDDAMRKVVENINISLNKKERNIAISHGYVTYMKGDEFEELEESESEKPLAIGGTELINVKHFENFNYTALGHLHGPQKVYSDKVRYSGSLMKYSFSEVNQKKGITVIDLMEDGEVEISFIPLVPKRDFRVISGTLSDIISNNNDDKNKEDYIKIVLKDKGELLDPMAKIRAIYPNTMELIREERIRANSENKAMATNIKERSKLNLFQSFYEDIVGDELNDDELEIMSKIINKAENGGENNED